MNRLLEQNAVPTLWTTNLTDEIDPSILRRVMFAMELRMPPPKVRARIWTRQLSRHGIEADANDALALPTEFEATPGVAAGTTAAAKLGGGGLDTVRHGVRNLSRVLSYEKPSQRPPETFEPTFIRSDKDLVRLADRRMAQRTWEISQIQRDADLDGKPPVALCLHDQPRGEAGPSHVAPLYVQGQARLPHPRPGSGMFRAYFNARPQRNSRLSRS